MTRLRATRLNIQLLSTSRPSKKERGTNRNPPNKLAIGLSVGFALLVTIIVCWTWIHCRRRKAKEKSDRKNQHPEHGYIDEEEDSVPYRIVDLQTNISTDASGYTFLEAKKDEEQPYMKLKPNCSRIHNEEGDMGETENGNHSFEEIADEPVYFMLEGKGKSSKT
ncbi:uncharacterized protein LOC114542161 [Dendronephthya gigantea]|uniref:uncharacterized protein LOC114542161 n=1 Tax=Dendronephthya gigantea TaxID=151771 RepID=UPI00106C44F6|nr:uncharacterized protein LOC114542161 [Dendronephthya gigantea]